MGYPRSDNLKKAVKEEYYIPHVRGISGVYETEDDGFLIINADVFENMLISSAFSSEGKYSDVKEYYSRKLVDDYLKNHNTKMTYKEAIQEYGVEIGKSYVRTHKEEVLKQLGITENKEFTYENARDTFGKQIIAEYLAGHKQEVAESYNLEAETARQQSVNAVRREHLAKGREARKLQAEYNASVRLSLILSHHSIVGVSERLGCARSSVQNTLKSVDGKPQDMKKLWSKYRDSAFKDTAQADYDAFIEADCNYKKFRQLIAQGTGDAATESESADNHGVSGSDVSALVEDAASPGTVPTGAGHAQKADRIDGVGNTADAGVPELGGTAEEERIGARRASAKAEEDVYVEKMRQARARYDKPYTKAYRSMVEASNNYDRNPQMAARSRRNSVLGEMPRMPAEF